MMDVLLRTLIFGLLLYGGLATSVPTPWAASEESRLPLPRFVTLRAQQANMRSGPGEQYPIKWTYQRPGVPLEVIREHHHWRQIRDWQGAEGWMHSSMLSSKRSVMVVGGIRTLRDQPDPRSGAAARVEGPAIGRLLSCQKAADWCRVEFGGVKGWLRRADMWGVYDSEEVN
jgi:SH3-like domain-containing protein